MAEGEYIGLLDCDDILSPNALYEMVKKLNEDAEYDFIYSDEDMLTEDGKTRYNPVFKTEWAPDTFMSVMYTNHFSIFKRSIAMEIGGYRVGYEGSQDYDFVLRFTEKTRKIGHVSKILYHWRSRAESVASNPETKMYAYEAAMKAKKDALPKGKGRTYTVPERETRKEKAAPSTGSPKETRHGNTVYFELGIGTLVHSPLYGNGKISEIGSGRLTVAFDSGDQEFRYPQAFADGEIAVITED